MTTTDMTNYEHSYITIQIYDGTIYTDEVKAPTRKEFNGMQVGFFAGGRDNKLMYMPNQTEYLREFCNPNFRKLGQAAYNADNVLSTDNAGMYILNLRPDTATYANVLVMVKFRLVETDKGPEITPPEPEEPPVVPGEAEVLPYPGGKIKVGNTDKNTLSIASFTAKSLRAAYAGELGPADDGVEEDLDDLDKEDANQNAGTGERDGTGDTGTTPKPPLIGEGEDNLDPNEPTDPDTPKDPEDPEQKYYKLEYSFYGKYVDGATTLDRLFLSAINTMETEVDEDGFFNMPLYLIYALGRGEYGNTIRARMENATEYDIGFDENPPELHTYKLRILEPTTIGLKEREVNPGTFDEDAFDRSTDYGPSLYMEDVVNDVQFGSQRIGMKIYMPTFNAICQLYNQYIATENEVTPGTLDLFTQLNLDGTPNTNLSFISDCEGFLNLFSLDGVQLVGGTDGWQNMSETQIKNTKEELLLAAYRGDIDPVIKSRFSSPCNFNLDANYSINVKKEMAALANRRKYDMMTYLDLGRTSTISGLTTVAEQMRSIYGYNVVKEGQCYNWRDVNYTGKICNMTITHWLGKHLANHMGTPNKGLAQPMAMSYAVLSSPSDYVPGSFKPTIDPDNDPIIDSLHRLRVNCYTTVTNTSVQRAHAITSCQEKSDRMLEMNEYITQRAIKILYDILRSKLWKLGEQSDRNDYEEQANDVLKYQLGPYVRAVSAKFEMTAQDEKNSLLRLKAHITFKTVVLRGDLILYLDPRVPTTEIGTSTSTITMVS